jgi:histidine triad (HIT) family protein
MSTIRICPTATEPLSCSGQPAPKGSDTGRVIADCVFCEIVTGATRSRKVYEDAEVLAFHDIHPRAPVHVLVIPKRHITSASDLTEADVMLAGRLLLVARQVAAELGIADSGYRLVNNCGAHAGQTVWHLHLHILGGRQMGWPPG